MLLSYFYKFFERSDVVSSFDHSSKYFLKHCAASPGSKTVFPNLVIYHEIRDFEHEPRDKNFCSVTSHESPKSP